MLRALPQEQWTCSDEYLHLMNSPHFSSIQRKQQLIYSSCHKIFFQKCNTAAEKPPKLGKFKGKIKILTIHGLLYQKFAAVCQKFQLPVLPTFSAHDAAKQIHKLK